MTFAQFVRAAVSLWYVVILGVAATAYGVHEAREGTAAYWSKTTVSLLPSRIESNGGNELLSKGPTALAAVVVTNVNHSSLKLSSASNDASLVGMGETSATLIQLRNGGGQWLPRAAGPYIDIEAVDASPEQVEKRIGAAVSKVRAEVDTVQTQLGVPDQVKVVASQSPPSVVVDVIQTSPSRAVAAIGLAGVAGTIGTIMVLDRIRAARRRRRNLERALMAMSTESAGRTRSAPEASSSPS